MSTKIYTAWRCRTNTFPKFLEHFRKNCFKTAVRYIRETFKSVFDAKENFETVFDRRVAPKLYAASVSKISSQYCVDASLNVWYHNRHFYIIPYGILFKTYKPVEGVTDYSYWDNADRPDNITRRQWRNRYMTWSAVCLDNWDIHRLQYDIINIGQNVGFQELADKLNYQQSVGGIYHALKRSRS